MARNIAECQAMIDAARRGGAQLCIGHNRRFRNNVSLAKRLMEKGILGEVTRIQAEEGSTADWPRSPAYFDPSPGRWRRLDRRGDPLDRSDSLAGR